jgi:hypothetical protein
MQCRQRCEATSAACAMLLLSKRITHRTGAAAPVELGQPRTRRMLLEKHLQAARLRCKELELQLKHSKRELRTSRKAVKTFEMMASMHAQHATMQQQQQPAPGSPGQSILQSFPSINIHSGGSGPAQIARFDSAPQSPASPGGSPGMQIYTAYPYNMVGPGGVHCPHDPICVSV